VRLLTFIKKHVIIKEINLRSYKMGTISEIMHYRKNVYDKTGREKDYFYSHVDIRDIRKRAVTKNIKQM
jgi:hypothetical protein